jgi:hypothetical protein
LPWAHLTRFSVQCGQSIAVLHTVLCLAPNLVAVNWELASGFQIVVSPTVKHSCLRDLSIHVARIAHCASSSSLDCIFLSSLRALSIDAPGPFWSLPQFSSFVSQNCHALESFELSSWDIPGWQLVACMKALPSVSHLALSLCVPTTLSIAESKLHVAQAVRTVLQALSCITDREDLANVALPKLKSITIRCRVLDRCEIGSKFVDMVESRWRIPALTHGRDPSCQSNVTISPISAASLKLDCSPNFSMDPADLDRLQILRDDGLPVQVSLSYKYRHSGHKTWI